MTDQQQHERADAAGSDLVYDGFIPNDELESEEVTQHRRTIRTAWARLAAIGVLAVVAAALGIQSADNAQLAATREMAAFLVLGPGLVGTETPGTMNADPAATPFFNGATAEIGDDPIRALAAQHAWWGIRSHRAWRRLVPRAGLSGSILAPPSRMRADDGHR